MKVDYHRFLMRFAPKLAGFIAFVCLALSSPAQSTFNASYSFANFTTHPLNVPWVSVTPLAAGADYQGLTLSSIPMNYTVRNYPTLTNGTLVVSNLISGYAYSVQFADGFSNPTITNYFDTNVVGTGLPVNGGQIVMTDGDSTSASFWLELFDSKEYGFFANLKGAPGNLFPDPEWDYDSGGTPIDAPAIVPLATVYASKTTGFRTFQYQTGNLINRFASAGGQGTGAPSQPMIYRAWNANEYWFNGEITSYGSHLWQHVAYGLEANPPPAGNVPAGTTWNQLI